MTSIKVKFRTSSREGHDGVIYYQVIHNREVKIITTKYRIKSSEWDDKTSQIIKSDHDRQRLRYLSQMEENIEDDLSTLEGIINAMKRKSHWYITSDVVDEFNCSAHGTSLYEFGQNAINRLRELGHIRTAETYIATINSFRRFREGKSINMESINTAIMQDYERYLVVRGVAMNTVSFYMRILRAIYNKAVDQELIVSRNPFKHVYTGIAKTIKRALPLKIMQTIKSIDLSSNPKIDLARDIFMFSFYTRGMSFVDMAYLRKADLNNGVLTYYRRKTGQLLTVKWETRMQNIVDKYKNEESKFLLPIITNMECDDRTQYRNSLMINNYNLKKLGQQLGLALPLTMYVARHSWASVAKGSEVPISVISESMGHGSEMTTQIYLTSLDTSVVDKANSMIINLL